MNFYNEIDPGKAAWLRELIRRDVISPGRVEERSILELPADGLVRYRQFHFFAGIGIWSYALRLAGWPDDCEVWSGSCPCQPFSVAGQGKGTADERHLWPAWFRLISLRRPVMVFGEQVADGDGQTWLDTVQSDMESIGYRFGSVALPAAGFGAPHGRHRTFFVADAKENGGFALPTGQKRKQESDAVRECSVSSMAHNEHSGRGRRPHNAEGQQPNRTAPGRDKGQCDIERDSATGDMATTRKTDADKGVRTPEGCAKERARRGNGLDLLTVAQLMVSGTAPSGSIAETKNIGQLNPAHSRWLMALPPVFCDCAVTAMESLRKSRRNLSKPT